MKTKLKLSVKLSIVILTVATLGMASGSSPAVAGVSHPQNLKLRHGTSSNWSGYATYGANSAFNSVSANWTQPSVDCTSGNGYSSFWVGLDGYNNSSVEQLGTEADCSQGKATYYAWYEMYPHPSFYANNVTVHAGDQLSASVTYSNSKDGGRYTLAITNATTGKSFSTTQKANSAKRASAEVVVEAPWSNGTLPLSNFGTANFTSAQANGQPLGGFANLDPITMINPYGMKSTPGSFDSTKQNFSVTWSAN